MISVTSFTERQRDGVAALILPIQQQEFGLPITLAAQPDLLDIAGFYQHGAGNFWVAEEQGRVIGTLALLDIGNRQAALRKMFVAATHRGAAHGVAARLLQTLLDWGRARGVDDIYLGTTARFIAAHRFYAKNGFGEIARSALPAAFPLMSVDSLFYHRRLAAA